MKDMNRRSALALGLAASAATPLLISAGPAVAIATPLRRSGGAVGGRGSARGLGAVGRHQVIEGEGLAAR